MKLVVFSDIHGNRYAFDAFINELERIKYDYLIFCGDIFGYYYDQQYIFEKLQKMKKLIWLKGNHDDYFLKAYCDCAKERELIKNYGHSYHNIRGKYSDTIYRTLKELSDKAELYMDKQKIGIFHGTPEDSLMGRLYPNNQIVNKELYSRYDIVILGHTHFRMARYLRNMDTLIVNPGSLGQPRDGKGSCYLVLDIIDKKLEFYTIKYDNTELYKQIDLYDKELAKLKDVLERKELDY